MASASRDLTVNFIGKTNKLTGPLQRIGGRMQSIGRGLTLGVTAPLAALGGMSINAASDLQESMSKVDVVFGDSARVIQDWSKTAAASFGMSQQQALEASGTFGNLFTAMGLGQKDAAGMSTEMVELAGDLASFNNMDPEEVLVALRSGLVGEIEPLRRLGINMNAATVEAKAMEMGLADANGEISEAAKVQARAALIMEQTTTAQGDFARTSEGLANRQRILKARFADMSAQLGAILLPIAEKAVNIFQGLAERFSNLSPETKKLIVQIAGVAAAVGPLLFVGGKLISNFARIGKAFTVLSKLFMANPWLLLAAAIIALVVLIVKNWDKIKEVTLRVWNTVKEFVGNAIDAVVGFFKGLPGRIGDLASSLLQKGKDLLRGLWDGIQEIWDDTILPWLEDLPTLVKDKIGDLLSTLKIKGRALLNGLWNGIKEFWRDTVKPWFKGLPDTIKGVIGDLIGTLKAKGRILISGFLIGLTDRITSVREWIKGLPARIVTWIGDLAETLKSKGRMLINGLLIGATKRVSDLREWIKGLPARIVTWIGDLTELLLQKGKDVVTGFLDGVEEQARSIPGRIAELFRGDDFDPVQIRAQFVLDVQAALAAVDRVRRRVNNMFNRLPFPVPDFHSGGIVPGRPGQEVPAILEAGERVIPANQVSSGGSGGHFTQNVTVNMPPGVNAEAVLAALQRLQRRRGPLPLRVA